MKFHPRALLAAAAAAVAIELSGFAGAATAGELLAGKTITVVVGYGAGGGYDAYARLAADHLGRHIPGSPTVVVENMEGGGGRRAEVYLATAAPRDGTTISLLPDGIALDSAQKLIPNDFDASTLGYIGRLTSGSNVEVTWQTSPTKGFKDAQQRETILGASGAAGNSATVPRILNAILGAKFKIVEGYKGTSDVVLAMERGEVEGAVVSLQTLQAMYPQWIAEKSVNFLWLQGMERASDFPDLPTLPELAETPEQRAILELVSSNAALGRSLAAPPEVPPATLAVLRKAFDEMIGDPDFIADARRRKLPLDPLSGEAVQKMVAETMATPAAAVQQLRDILEQD